MWNARSVIFVIGTLAILGAWYFSSQGGTFDLPNGIPFEFIFEFFPAILFPLFFLFIIRKVIGYVRKVSPILAETMKLQGQPLFLCDEVDEPENGNIQLWGNPMTAVRPGMRIALPDGSEREILEVYADDETPEDPDTIAEANVPGTPLVIKGNTEDKHHLDRALAAEGILKLKLIDPRSQSN